MLSKLRIPTLVAVILFTIVLFPGAAFAEGGYAVGGTSLTVQAAAHTQDEAVAWARNMADTHEYCGECVALIQKYYAYLGVSVPNTNANTYANEDHKPSGWTIDNIPSLGAVYVEADYSPGHVSIVVGVDSSGTLTTVDSNVTGTSVNQYCAQYFPWPYLRARSTYAGVAGKYFVHPQWANSDVTPGSYVIPTGNYHIVSALDSDRCLHATGSNNGDNIDLGSLSDDSNTAFYINWIGDGYYEIGPAGTGKFADVAGANTGDGINVQVWEGVGNDYQKWIIKDAGDGYFYILSRADGYALDVAGGSTDRGTNVTTWTLHEADNQKWRFELVGESRAVQTGEYNIVSAVDSDRCLHTTGTSNGNNADLGSLREDDNTVFTVEWNGQGGYYDIAPKGGRYLDVAGATTGSGVNVQVWDGVGNNYQKWVFVESGDGYAILSKASGLALDVAGGKTARGTNVQTWIANGGSNQRWKFVKADAGGSDAKSDISGASISGVVDKAYAGGARTQSLAVRLGSKTLKEETDYTVSYENNVNVGIATVIVTGKGDYTGSKCATFEITAQANDSGSSSAISQQPNSNESAVDQQTGSDVQPDQGSGTSASSAAMHRLYNGWSGEHFYTSDDEEFAGLVELGWTDEGTGWTAPAWSNAPVYRMYNPYAGEHHYTMDAGEKDSMVAAGWADEGIGWCSDDAETIPLYREYNPNEPANNHNCTTSSEEHDGLVALGWRDEGIAWYGV